MGRIIGQYFPHHGQYCDDAQPAATELAGCVGERCPTGLQIDVVPAEPETTDYLREYFVKGKATGESWIGYG